MKPQTRRRSEAAASTTTESIDGHKDDRQEIPARPAAYEVDMNNKKDTGAETPIPHPEEWQSSHTTADRTFADGNDLVENTIERNGQSNEDTVRDDDAMQQELKK